MLRIDMLLNFLECLLIGDSITAIKKLKNCSVLVNYVSGTLFTILSNKYDNNKKKNKESSFIFNFFVYIVVNLLHICIFNHVYRMMCVFCCCLFFF